LTSAAKIRVERLMTKTGNCFNINLRNEPILLSFAPLNKEQAKNESY